METCLVLVDREGDLDFAVAERLALDGTDLAPRVLTVAAPAMARRGARECSAAELRIAGGAWWSTIMRDALEVVEEELVVFLEASSLADYTGAASLALELAASDAGAIAARVVDPRGITISFDRGIFDVLAHGDSEYRGFVATSVPMTQRSSLFFDGRAFAARRSALLEVGPPHPDLEDVLGLVDLGWRLWLAGHPVRTSASVVVVEREGTGTKAARVPAAVRRAREQRAAHRILAEVLEPDNLALAYALSLAVGAADSGDGSRSLLSRDPHAGLHPSKDTAVDAMVVASALQALAAGADGLAEQRAAIQEARVLTDDALFAEVGTIFRAHTHTPQGNALRGVFTPRPRRTRASVLILCSDDLGLNMAGPAIRSVELARALLPGVEPVIAAHRVDPDADLPCPAVALSTEVLRTLLAEVDAVVLQGPVSDWFPEVLQSTVPIAVDLYDPMHLEALQRVGAAEEMPYVLNLVIAQLRRGDFFFCASERQRDYWLGMLSSLGRVTPSAYAEDQDLRSLIDVVPFGIPASTPVRTGPGPRASVEGIGPDDVLLVWNGGLWDWFDPETLLHALARVRTELPTVRAYFMGVRRPGSTELAPAALRVMALAEELGLTGHSVFFNDWTPYDRRQDVYLDATAVVSLNRSHLESRFSFRTRLLDALWGRVPILCTSGDVVAGIVEELQLGVTVPAGDVDAVAQALRDLVANPALLEHARARLEGAAPAYEWAHAVEPLERWLAEPARRGERAVRVVASPPGSAGDARRDLFERYSSDLKLLVPTPVRQHVLGPAKRQARGLLRWVREAR